MKLWQPFNKNFLEFKTFALALAWKAVAGAGDRGKPGMAMTRDQAFAATRNPRTKVFR